MRILSKFWKLILADSNGDCNLRFQAMIEALLVFAACGLFNYAKSVYLHLQIMSDIQRKNELVCKQFKEGKFVVQRSHK